MADKMVKLRLLADSFNLYHYDEDGIPIKKRGYKRVVKGDTFEVPDYVAERLVNFRLPSPMTNFVRRNAAIADSDDDPYRDSEDGKFVTLAPGVSQRPEYDFGSTTVGGELIADPNNDLEEQRDKARVAEVAAVAKADAKGNRPQAQQSAPQQNKEAAK